MKKTVISFKEQQVGNKTVNKKINDLQKKWNADEVSEWTFAPNVEPEKKNYLKGYQNLEKSINKKAIDKYLERMIITRLREEEKQKQKFNACGSGNNWTPKYTIPKAPKLTSDESNKKLYWCNNQSTRQLEKENKNSVKNIEPVSEFRKYYSTHNLAEYNSKAYDTKNYRRNQCCPQSEDLEKLLVSNPSKELFQKYAEKEDEYIKFHPKMDYEEAVQLIHKTILSLGS